MKNLNRGALPSLREMRANPLISPTQPNAFDRAFLLIAIFAAGACTLATEFTASRMIQTVYGASNLIWANVIGLILLFLTLGYFLGGRLVDRNPSFARFYAIICAAGLSSAASLLLTSYFLKASVAFMDSMSAAPMFGCFLAVAAALAVPITLLGCISPFALRLAVTDVAEAGRVSGRIYAVSTLGSLLGTYLPVLFTIPYLGSRLTALLFGAILCAIGGFGFYRASKQAALPVAAFLALLPLALLFARGPIKIREGQIFEAESAYNYIQVVENENCKYLLLNEGSGMHAYHCAGNDTPEDYYTLMLAAPYWYSNPEPPRNLLVVGLAGGTLVKHFQRAYGRAPIDGIEIDPEVVKVGRKFFELDSPSVRVIEGDGRFELNRLHESYDMIAVDVFKLPYIPWHFTTKEFFAEAKSKLSDRGTLVFNVFSPDLDPRLAKAIIATAASVFPSVHAVRVPGELNTVVFATNQPTSSAEPLTSAWRAKFFGALAFDPILHWPIQTIAYGGAPKFAGAPVFTDDLSQAEAILDSSRFRKLKQVAEWMLASDR